MFGKTTTAVEPSYIENFGIQLVLLNIFHIKYFMTTILSYYFLNTVILIVPSSFSTNKTSVAHLFYINYIIRYYKYVFTYHKYSKLLNFVIKSFLKKNCTKHIIEILYL